MGTFFNINLHGDSIVVGYTIETYFTAIFFGEQFNYQTSSNGFISEELAYKSGNR